MLEAQSFPSPEARLGREPTSADDIVVMISDVLYDYLSVNGDIKSEQEMGRLLEILERPLAIEIYENEMARREPRDVDRWQ